MPIGGLGSILQPMLGPLLGGLLPAVPPAAGPTPAPTAPALPPTTTQEPPAPAPATDGATTAPAATSVSSGSASYVRPTPQPETPRIPWDDPVEKSSSFDWARRAAQAVVAHARFMEWVDRVGPLNPDEVPDLDGLAETRGQGFRSAVAAYDEFADVPTALAPSPSRSASVVMRDRDEP